MITSQQTLESLLQPPLLIVGWLLLINGIDPWRDVCIFGWPSDSFCLFISWFIVLSSAWCMQLIVLFYIVTCPHISVECRVPEILTSPWYDYSSSISNIPTIPPWFQTSPYHYFVLCFVGVNWESRDLTSRDNCVFSDAATTSSLLCVLSTDAILEHQS